MTDAAQPRELELAVGRIREVDRDVPPGRVAARRAARQADDRAAARRLVPDHRTADDPGCTSNDYRFHGSPTLFPWLQA